MKPKLKVCGMKHNLAEVASLQPDYLGFIFFNDSPRNYGPDPIEIDPSIKKVGVFVNETVSEIIAKVELYQLDVIQLHGDENVDFCNELKQIDRIVSRDVQIWKVFSVGDKALDFEALSCFETIVDKFLFDTKGANFGGNGITFNWETLKEYTSKTPFILSGGIGIDELAKIKELLNTKLPIYAIDVNSKFESAPGLKEIDKIKEFMTELQNF